MMTGARVEKGERCGVWVRGERIDPRCLHLEHTLCVWWARESTVTSSHPTMSDDVQHKNIVTTSVHRYDVHVHEHLFLAGCTVVLGTCAYVHVHVHVHVHAHVYMSKRCCGFEYLWWFHYPSPGKFWGVVLLVIFPKYNVGLHMCRHGLRSGRRGVAICQTII